ncbi:MAG: hypothetical protein HYT80_05105, partial [Euryarchaeota archaeon]|nr:hypothetical protein [Euryarchaeota archaeon]
MATTATTAVRPALSEELERVNEAIDQLTRGAAASDLDAQTPYRLHFDRMVVPVDQSKATFVALEWARMLGDAFNSTVWAVHVL